MTRTVFLRFDDLIGVPYLDGGRDPKEGLDCIGLVLVVQRRLGRHVIDPVEALVASIRKTRDPSLYLKPEWSLSRSPIGRGDLVLMHEGRGMGPSHSGIAIDSTRVLHASKALGVVATPIEAISRAGCLHSVWKWLG